MKKSDLLLILLIVLLVFIIGCAKEVSEEELAQDLDNLTEEELSYVLSEDEENLAGEAYKFSSNRFTKLNYLKKSIKPYRMTCSDSDGGSDYQEAGFVTLFNYPGGVKKKSDKCWNDGKRLQEYVCEDGKYKGDHTFDCSSLGVDYVCKDNACVEKPCNTEINIEENFGRELRIDYCTHLKNNNDLKIYFSYDTDKLIIYTVREFEDQDYLLDYKIFDSPMSYVPRNIYSNGERIDINNFDDSEISITINDNCPVDYPYCNSISEDISDFDFVESDILKHYYDNSLFTSNEVKDNYANKAIDVNKESINFLQTNLGIFPPVDKLVQFDIYAPDLSGVSYSSGFWIVNRKTEQVTQNSVDRLQYGNTHEFVHTFFYGIPVERSWFEEGLADYMGHAIKEDINLFCREDGWEEGYIDYWGDFISHTGIIPYSDFTVSSENTEELYDPLNTPSYYSSAECFWVYIEENYGSEALKEVTQAWHDMRKVLPPQKKWLVKDIINPTLGVNLSPLVQIRYNYVEE